LTDKNRVLLEIRGRAMWACVTDLNRERVKESLPDDKADHMWGKIQNLEKQTCEFLSDR
jgi:hypothetical protein